MARNLDRRDVTQTQGTPARAANVKADAPEVSGQRFQGRCRASAGSSSRGSKPPSPGSKPPAAIRRLSYRCRVSRTRATLSTMPKKALDPGRSVSSALRISRKCTLGGGREVGERRLRRELGWGSLLEVNEEEEGASRDMLPRLSGQQARQAVHANHIG